MSDIGNHGYPARLSVNAPRITTAQAVGPIDSSTAPRWSGPSTFALLPNLLEVPHADVVIVGVPWDSGVSYRPGARFAPAHIRQASRLLRPYNPAGDTYPFGYHQVVDAGDIAINPFDIAAAIEELQDTATQLVLAGQTMVTLGGDHTIALPLLRSVAAAHGPVAVLHFDAHLDTWDTYFGAEYTHGTPFRRAVEEGVVDTEALCHVGTRGPLYGHADLSDDRRFGFGIVSSNDVYRWGVDEVVARLRDRVGSRPLYISIDIDVLDPAFAPGTGTPEAGGLLSWQLLEIVRGLRGLNVVGADLVEVLPASDHAEITGIAASHLVYEILSILAPRVEAES